MSLSFINIALWICGKGYTTNCTYSQKQKRPPYSLLTRGAFYNNLFMQNESKQPKPNNQAYGLLKGYTLIFYPLGECALDTLAQLRKLLRKYHTTPLYFVLKTVRYGW